jgi:hypothetical protein
MEHAVVKVEVAITGAKIMDAAALVSAQNIAQTVAQVIQT